MRALIVKNQIKLIGLDCRRNVVTSNKKLESSFKKESWINFQEHLLNKAWAKEAEVDQEKLSTPAEHQGPAGVPPPGIKSRDRDMETSLGQQRESVNCFFGAQEKISGRNVFPFSLGVFYSSIQKG